jgi:hypothetical protein
MDAGRSRSVIPGEWLMPYLASNTVAVLLLLVAFTRPEVTRWASALIFLAAAAVNTRLAIIRPLDYLDYGALTPITVYREFIYGWFSQHVPMLVLPIAAGQLAIAVLLTRSLRWRRLGIAGAVFFLLAIAPLGVGSAFPFSLLMIGALLVMEQRLRPGLSPEGQSPSPSRTIFSKPQRRTS